MLMVGAKVLFNSAKMLKMGVLVVFMHDYGHQEALIDIITLVLCQGVPVGPSVAIWGCLWGGVRGCFFNPPYGLITADLKNGPMFVFRGALLSETSDRSQTNLEVSGHCARSL